MEKASKSLFTSIFLDMVVVLKFAWIWRVALDYSLGTSQSSGEGAQGMVCIIGMEVHQLMCLLLPLIQCLQSGPKGKTPE